MSFTTIRASVIASALCAAILGCSQGPNQEADAPGDVPGQAVVTGHPGQASCHDADRTLSIAIRSNRNGVPVQVTGTLTEMLPCEPAGERDGQMLADITQVSRIDGGVRLSVANAHLWGAVDRPGGCGFEKIVDYDATFTSVDLTITDNPPRASMQLGGIRPVPTAPRSIDPTVLVACSDKESKPIADLVNTLLRSLDQTRQ